MTRDCPWLALTLVTCMSGLGYSATLERLSMDDMIQKSTAIVRGRVQSSSSSFRGVPGRGGMIYTRYVVRVVERWKGAAAGSEDVAVPGGYASGLRQLFPGAPALEANAEYVFFLWTSPRGLTQIIGLSQGLLNSKVDASGKAVLFRGAASEQMLDASGRIVTDSSFSLSLADFRTMMQAHGLASGK